MLHLLFHVKNHLCKEMLDQSKKASFFQGIGPNPLFAQEEQVFKDNFMHYMALGLDNYFMLKTDLTHCWAWILLTFI